MKYLSVCSGIEAATVAWHDLGWTPVAFSEIEPFPSAVLAHHYPDVPNVGDMTKFKEWNLEPIDLLVGGTPCQSFSVAGLRKGLDDPRGNLMLTFLAIAECERPRWIVWENVPGVLSSNGGQDFGTFLAALGELGYGWAYRVLDAQWFGVAQRRRRVFVVGCLGDQAGAAKVLFESESVQRNPAPSREARQGAARGVTPSVAGSLDTECGGRKLTHQSVADGHTIGTLTARMMNALGTRDVEEGALLPVAQPVAYGIDGEQNASEELIGTLRSHQSGGYEGARVAQPVAIQDVRAVEKAQNGRGWNDDGTAYTVDTYATQGVAVAQPVAFSRNDDGRDATLDLAPTMRVAGRAGGMLGVAQPVAFAQNTRDEVRLMNGDGSIVGALAAEPGMKQTCYVAQPVAFKVRGGVEVDSAGKAAGKGYLGSEETAFTLAATQDQWIGQPVGTDCYNGAITGEVAATMGTTGSSVNASGPTVMQAVAFEPGSIARNAGPAGESDLAPTLRREMGDNQPAVRIAMQAVAPALTASNDPSRSPQSSEGTQQVTAVHQVTMQVRRLTPVECERLQGFPDGYTNIPWRKKDEAPDGPRYKALGNSMAVPCMAWIGQRIAEVDRGD